MKILFYEHIAASVFKEHEIKRKCKYSTIIKKLGLDGCFCIVDGDETLYYPDCKDLKPKSEVIHIKRVPEKSKGNLLGAIVGALFVVVGAVLFFTGVGTAVGVGLMVSGAGMMVGAGISELMTPATNAPSLSQQKQKEERYGLTGASNRVSLGSKYPVIFGKHVVTPPIVGNYYTELENNDGTGDQFMRVLLCVGYNQLKLTDFKIGTNELAKNSGDIRNGNVPVTGSYDAEIEIRQDGLYPNLYNKRHYEEQISAEVQYFPSEADYTETRTTVKNTTSIYIILSFQGLYSVSSSGGYQRASATIGVKYRKKGGVAWTAVGETTYTNNKNSVLRYYVQKTFSAAEMASNPSGEWEVIVYRLSPASTSSTIMNKCYWATLRSDTEQVPVIQKELNKMCVVALKIRANEHTSGILDKISVVAQSVFPVWDGVDWNTTAPTSNPAACYLGALRSNFLTKRVGDDRIDWDALQSFYEWCDTNGYECNGVISNGEQVFNILNKILQTSRANFYLKDGLYSLTHDIPTSNPVALFTPKNSRNFSAQKLFPTHVDGIDATFNDASNEWTTDNQIVYPYGYTETGDENNQEMNMWGVTKYEQVVKLSRYILACNALRPEVYSLTVGLEHFGIPLGSRCLIQTDVLLVGLAGGRIKAVNGQKIQIDEIVQVQNAGQYAIKIFKQDGTIINVPVNAPTMPVDTLTAQGPFSAQAGDIYAFGTYGNETIDCIVTGKTIGDNLSATITFMPYAPDVFNCDSQPIPAYDPHITKPVPQGYSIIGDSLEPSKGVAVQDDGVVYYDFGDYAKHDDAGNYFYNRGALLDLGKGYWSGLNFYQDSLNWADSRITNCVTEIPEDIKLELSAGTLTLKSGSVITFPDGNQYQTSTDRTLTFTSNGQWYVVATNLGVMSVCNYPAKSGTTDPASPSGRDLFYNTSESKCKRWNGNIWENRSFPIAVVTVANGAISSIDKAFNGAGYVGQHAFILPGVKGLLPFGFNTDGTLSSKNRENTDLAIVSLNTGLYNGYERRISLIDGNPVSNTAGYVEIDTRADAISAAWVRQYVRSENLIISRTSTDGPFVEYTGGIYPAQTPILTYNYDGTTVTQFDVMDVRSVDASVHFGVDNALYKNVSVSMFLKALVVSAGKKYIFRYNDPDNDNILELYTENNSVYVNCQGYVQEITGYDFTQQHHLCIIRDVVYGLLSIYVDGQPYVVEQNYGTFTYNLISETDDNLISETGDNLTSEEQAVGIADLDRDVNFYLFSDEDGANNATCSIAKFRLYRRILSEKEIDVLSSDGIISTMIEILNRYLGEYVDAPDESKIGDTFDYSGTTNEEFINGERYLRTLSGWVLYGG